MENISGRAGVVALLVILLVTGVAAASVRGTDLLIGPARQESGGQGSRGQGSTGQSPSGQEPGGQESSAPASGAGAPTPTTPPQGSGQPEPQERQVSEPSSFQQVFSYPDGLVVDVSKVTRSRLDADVARSGLEKGDLTQRLTLRLTNNSDATLTLPRGVAAVMTYGPRQRVAATLPTKGARPLTAGQLRPGRSTTADYTFAVPRKHINAAQLQLRLGAARSAATFRGSLDYYPSDSTLFNDPSGSKADQMRITRHIERSIDAAPAGSTIRLALYSFDITRTAEKLVAAHKRGVHVQMLVDQHEQIVTKQTQMMIKALGEDPGKKSYLVRCGASCMSNRPSTMHVKFYLFSAVGPARLISMVGSANITHTNSGGSWNEMQTIVGNAALYDSLKRYFLDMVPDDNDRNYYRTTTSGPYTLYMFPRAKDHRVLMLKALDRVTCKGAAKGYGKNGRTVIEASVYSWRGTRVDIAQKLWRLHDQGCDVHVIINSGRTDLGIKRTLTRRSSKHGVMDVRDAWYDRNGNDIAERYMHQKGIHISGVWDGNPRAKVVYSGSLNWVPGSTTDNNELVLRTIDDATYDAYARNFRIARAKGTRPFW